MQMTGKGIIINKPYIYENQQSRLQTSGMGKMKKNHRNSFLELTEQMKLRSYFKSHQDQDQDFPQEYYMDFCAESEEGKDIFFQCDQKQCPGGKVVSIPYAMYGATQGSCPNFFTSYQCVKEVNAFVQSECIDAPDCEFEVESDTFAEYKWTTAWGNYEKILGCAGKQIKLQFVGSCKCQNNGKGGGESEEDKQRRKEEAAERKKNRQDKLPCLNGQLISFQDDKGNFIEETGKESQYKPIMKNGNVTEAGKWTCVQKTSKIYYFKSSSGRWIRGRKGGYVDTNYQNGGWTTWTYKKLKPGHFKFNSEYLSQCMYYGRENLVLMTGNHSFKGCDWTVVKY